MTQDIPALIATAKAMREQLGDGSAQAARSVPRRGTHD